MYILGDTSYGSCCVDEIAAAHINADSIIHFGHACLSKISRLPVLYVFPKFSITLNEFEECLQRNVPDTNEKLALFYDVGYSHLIKELTNQLKMNYNNLYMGSLATGEELKRLEPDILCWEQLKDLQIDEYTCIFIGKDNQTFFNISTAIKGKKWLLYDNNNIREVVPLETKYMRRRYYYVEKCKDAKSIGIVVGTLSTKGYLEIVERIQNLAKLHGIRSYIISVGKVNSAKLANFMEIDCFVLIGCPENNLYNSKDFYKPLVSVFEIELALNPAWHAQIPATYCTDFKELLPEGKLYKDENTVKVIENDISLVTGQMRHSAGNNVKQIIGFDGALVERSKNQLMEVTSSDAFQERSWRGLDPALGETSPALIQQGRIGIPIQYSENPTN